MKPERYAHVAAFAATHPWLILPEWGSVVAGVLARHIVGADSSAEIATALVNRKNLPQPKVGSVAILPVYGIIAPRVNLMSEMSGGTTFEKLTAQTRAAAADPSVRTIVLDIDSAGSNACGAIEYTRELLKARAKKPIVAQVQFLACSGAYWIAASCTEIVAAPSARVGSIGVYSIHDDLSALLAREGIKRTYLSVGEGKVDGNETGPLNASAEARRVAYLQDCYAQFLGGVVDGRGNGLTTARVRDEWKAFIYGSTEALSLGMIDRVASLNDTLTRLLSDSPDAADQRAALTFSTPDATDQEPPTAATSQEQTADRTWQNGLDAELLALEL